MKMKSMKMSKADRKAMLMPTAEAGSGPEYPWGLRLNLDADALDKLGMDDMPEAGAECEIHAKGKVIRVSQSANERGGDKSVEVQITRMALEGDAMDRRTLKAMNLDPDDPKVRAAYKREKR